MILWDANIPKDPDGILSYVHRVQVRGIRSWENPAIFGCVLKTLSSMESLTMVRTKIPPLDEIQSPVPFGEFGEALTSLTLISQSCTLATITSFILSLSNLKELVIDQLGITSEQLPSTLPDTTHRKPLRWLLLEGVPDVFETALVQHCLTCSVLNMDVCSHSVRQLIALSSETLANLSLEGKRFA